MRRITPLRRSSPGQKKYLVMVTVKPSLLGLLYSTGSTQPTRPLVPLHKEHEPRSGVQMFGSRLVWAPLPVRSM